MACSNIETNIVSTKCLHSYGSCMCLDLAAYYMTKKIKYPRHILVNNLLVNDGEQERLLYKTNCNIMEGT